MNKTAAHRSIARRAVLEKVAGVTKQATPLYTDEEDIKNYNRRKLVRRALLTAVGGLVGMGAGKSMFMNPWTGRGGHPLLGAGIGAGAALLGTTLMDKYYESAGLDPTVPSLKARIQAEAIRPSSGEKKAAEANEAAFVQGFCKAAEVAGVDPVALYKRADIGDSLWRALPDTSRGALVYHGLADPGTLLPLAGTIGGIHQVATALNPRREASKTERAIRGVAGLGLTAGGTYAMLDNDAKQAVRNAVYKLVGKLSKPATVAKALDTVAGRRAMA